MAPSANIANLSQTWEQRANRCAWLVEDAGASRDVLRFYEHVLRFQGDASRHCVQVLAPESGLREQIDVEFVAQALLPDLLKLVEAKGPAALAKEARELRAAPTEAIRELLILAVAPGGMEFDRTTFFARACLQPAAEALQVQLGGLPHAAKGTCPACGGLPQLAVLRSVGEGAERSLICSFCLREWVYRRVICPFCEEMDKEKLPRYKAEDFTYVGVEGCDTCRHYLKAVDLSLDGRAVPLVDEVAGAALDVWAGEHGYAKVVPNLMGF